MACIELQNAEFTAVDFETTGSVPGWPNEPWQIGAFRFSTGGAASSTFSSFLRISTGRPFNRYAPGRHAQIRGTLAESPTLAGIWGELSPWLRGGPLVAHNIGTERTILRAAAPLDRLGPWIDTLELSRRLLPGRASYALEDIIPDLGLGADVAALAPAGAGPHDALYDAIACGVLLRHFAAGGLAFCEASR
ncbi:MAG: 3'-5' exonuclease [Kiritimatiellae bacterium]|nr:3'-5' exonuclease [Kiritimatiellia bacterium]